MSAGDRRPEIDALKAAGIATIVLIHAIRSPWDPGVTAVEVWLGHVTRFGVPAFLFASGFLAARETPVPAAETVRRLRRILLPYLVASLGAQLWWALRGGSSETGSVALDLLLGASFGPFYYVFVYVVLVALTPLLARLPRAAIAALCGLFVAAQWCVDAATLWLLPLFWHLRSPLLWWAFFLLGWWLRLNAARVDAFVRRHRGALLGALLPAVAALAALSGLEGHAPRLAVRSAAWLGIYAILALLFAVACARPALPRPLRVLSEATYAIYLFHLFFVFGVQALWPPAAGALAIGPLALAWAAGLAGPLLLVAGARSLLGARSRDVVGA